jgi:mono/diheme cytochrome c family protein
MSWFRPGLLVTWVCAAVPFVALVAVYAVSERRLREFESPPPFEAEIPLDRAVRERGEHVARTRGCTDCHGPNLEGRDMSEEWTGLGRVIAVNLAAYAQRNSVPVIERAVRHGIGSDGRALYSMPSYNFTTLADSDVVALIAYMRSVPILGDTLGRAHHSLEVRWDLAFAGGTHMADWSKAVPAMLTTAAVDGEGRVRGEYTAMTTCNECHGLDLRGITAFGTTPDLAIVGGYTRDQFVTLMRRGVSRDGRDSMPLMSDVARGRFVHFTDAEVDDLYDFLTTLPGRAVATGVFWRR